MACLSLSYSGWSILCLTQMNKFLIDIYIQYRHALLFLQNILTHVGIYLHISMYVLIDIISEQWIKTVKYAPIILNKCKNWACSFFRYIYDGIKLMLVGINNVFISLNNKISNIIEERNRNIVSKKIESNDLNYYQELIKEYSSIQVFQFFKQLYLKKQIHNLDYYVKLIKKTKNEFLHGFNIYVDSIIDKNYTVLQLFYLLEIYNYLLIYSKQNDIKIIPHEITFDSKLLLFFNEYIKQNIIDIKYNNTLDDVIDIQIKNPNFYNIYILDFYTNDIGRIQLPNISIIYDTEQYDYYMKFKANVSYPIDYISQYSKLRKSFKDLFLNSDQSHIHTPQQYRVFILAEFY